MPWSPFFSVQLGVSPFLSPSASVVAFVSAIGPGIVGISLPTVLTIFVVVKISVLAIRVFVGIIPSGLLEEIRFWYGEDDIIRGEPIDSDTNQWFNFNLEYVSGSALNRNSRV